MSLDHVPHRLKLGNLHGEEQVHFLQPPTAVMERPQRDLGNNEGVHRDPAREQKTGHLRIALPEMVDPDGRIGEDHGGASSRYAKALDVFEVRLGSTNGGKPAGGFEVNERP